MTIDEAFARIVTTLNPMPKAGTIGEIDAEITRITKALSYPGPERRRPARIAEMHQMRDRLIAVKARLLKEAPEAAPKVIPDIRAEREGHG